MDLETQIMILSKLKINPNNPQIFDDLTKLKNSIKEFPKMMELRPLIYDPDTMYVLGGNKRLICLQKLGYKEIPITWIKSAKELTEEEKKRFIIADNIQFGEWNTEKLEEWNNELLQNWGLSIIINEKKIKKQIQEINPYKKTHILLSFEPEKFKEVSEMIKDVFKSKIVEIEQSSN